MKNLKNTFLIIVLIFASTINFFGQKVIEPIEDLLDFQGAVVKRTIIQPVRVFRGESYKLTTTEGNIEMEKCFGVTKILKYKIKKNKRALQDKLFTEKIYLLTETHDLGLFKYFEKSWKPDADGVWTDVLGLMSSEPLPKNYKRVLKQELFYDDLLFATHLVEFTAEDVKFSVVGSK
jgi:hypothetical protein